MRVVRHWHRIIGETLLKVHYRRAAALSYWWWYSHTKAEREQAVEPGEWREGVYVLRLSSLSLRLMMWLHQRVPPGISPPQTARLWHYN